MTTVTDEGLEWYRDISILANEEIDTIAVGTGDTSPTESDTSLENEVYRTKITNANASIEKGDFFNQFTCTIKVTGGGNVSASDEISELGIIAEGDTANEKLIARDVFPYVEVSSGAKEKFTIDIDIER
jgi:hypothetical protein